jgi:hypothetical protein
VFIFVCMVDLGFCMLNHDIFLDGHNLDANCIAVFRPQVSIATAMVFCHRFYLRQSLAKNDRRVSVIQCLSLFVFQWLIKLTSSFQVATEISLNKWFSFSILYARLVLTGS